MHPHHLVVRYLVATEMIGRLTLFVAGEKAIDIVKERFLGVTLEQPSPDADAQTKAALQKQLAIPEE